MMKINISKLDDERRDAILNAAIKEFAAQGYDEASTNVIAREAGISKGLMFHYVNSKKDLFLYLHEYCSDMINREYLDLMNFDENDIFERLRQSYLLQLDLLQKYPWIFEFTKIPAASIPDEINSELESKRIERQPVCFETLFEQIDESRFKQGLDIGRCKKLIFWANMGFTAQILDDMKNSSKNDLDYDIIVADLDGFFDELRKLFYQ